MNKIKSFVEKFQMFITNLPKFEATGTESIGSLDPKETAQCYRKVGGSYLVVYNLSGTTKHKAGFVKYAGGVTSAPTASKTYKNGSTLETQPLFIASQKPFMLIQLKKYNRQS